MVDERLKGIEEEERRKLGRWGFLEDIGGTPYRISTNSPDLGIKFNSQFVNDIEPNEIHAAPNFVSASGF